VTSNPDKPGVRERLVNAFQSSDLSIESGVRKDSDFLIALGLAQQNGRRVSGSLLRITMEGRQADYRSARQAVVEMTKRINDERCWRLSGPNCRLVGELALAHYIFPMCHHCEGRKFDLIPGTRSLSATPCQACHGTGERPIQRKHNNHIRDMIELLKQVDGATVAAVRRLVQ
jgi:hypothetical protein